MEKPAKFKVDPALTRILGESYSSVEAAIKELVDNCYDADASMVTVDFPNPFDHSKIHDKPNKLSRNRFSLIIPISHILLHLKP